MASYPISGSSSTGSLAQSMFGNLKAKKTAKASYPAPAPSSYQVKIDKNKKSIAALKTMLDDMGDTLSNLTRAANKVSRMQNLLRETRNSLLDAQATILKAGDLPTQYESGVTGTVDVSGAATLNDLGITKNSAGFDIQLASSASATTISFGKDDTVQTVLAQLNAVENVTASLNDSGQIEITADDGSAITLTDGTQSPLASLGFTAGTNTPIEIPAGEQDVEGIDREALKNSINSLISSINSQAGTSTYESDNILLGGSVKLRVSANSSAAIPVYGRNLSADSLGLQKIEGDIASDEDIAAALDRIAAAIDTVDSFDITLDNQIDLASALENYSENRVESFEKHNKHLTDMLAREKASSTRGLLSGYGGGISGLGSSDLASLLAG